MGHWGDIQAKDPIDCLRQQLLVLQRRYPRPRLSNADRRYWILASRWFGGWRRPLRIVRPETVLRWHRRGWKAYWTWLSHRPGKRGRRLLPQELRALIRRMAAENWLWGQKRIQAELARLGFKVSARTVAKYMRPHRNRRPSPGWRKIPKAARTEYFSVMGPSLSRRGRAARSPSILSGAASASRPEGGPITASA